MSTASASYPPGPRGMTPGTPLPAPVPPAAQRGPLAKLVNLPLPYLLGIGFVLALLSALVTAFLF